MKVKHLLTSDAKLAYWGHGEWVEEPDLIEFEYKTIQCRVERCGSNDFSNSGFGGHLCGYICIPKDHPWNELSWDNLASLENPPAVHGGLTYFAKEDTGFWIGFDCAHSGDLTPSFEFVTKILYVCSAKYREIKDRQLEFNSNHPNFPFRKNVYRNIDYVINECKSLAEQAARLIKNNS